MQNRQEDCVRILNVSSLDEKAGEGTAVQSQGIQSPSTLFLDERNTGPISLLLKRTSRRNNESDTGMENILRQSDCSKVHAEFGSQSAQSKLPAN